MSAWILAICWLSLSRCFCARARLRSSWDAVAEGGAASRMSTSPGMGLVWCAGPVEDGGRGGADDSEGDGDGDADDGNRESDEDDDEGGDGGDGDSCDGG